MSVRDAKRGAALAGAVLLALGAINTAFGSPGINPADAVTAVFGLALIGVAAVK